MTYRTEPSEEATTVVPPRNGAPPALARGLITPGELGDDVDEELAIGGHAEGGVEAGDL